mgnify:CR=1 FL=1
MAVGPEDRVSQLMRGYQRYSVRFQVTPPAAELLVAGQKQPMVQASDHEYVLQQSQLGSNDGEQKARFVFHLDGYQDQEVSLSGRELAELSGRPQHLYATPIRLRPASLGAYYTEYRPLAWLVGLGLLLALSRALLRAWRLRGLERRRKRYEELLEADRRDAFVGSQIGRYRLVARLGAGGMATVYRGVPDEDLEKGEHVAIKLIRPEQLSDVYRQRFFQETRVLCKLNHPNVVRVTDWGEQEGIPYLAMELVSGRTLSQMIPAGGMGKAEFEPILLQLLAGLRYAHAQGIVHRDIKPPNVMVTEAKLVKVMDFGLARAHDFESATLTGQAMGTPGYMPPEMLTEKSRDQVNSGVLADQYSLAVMLYQMLCGRRPFEHPESFKLLLMRVTQPSPCIRTFRPELSPAIAEVLAIMLERSPHARFPDLEAAERAWRAALAGTDFSARQEAPADPQCEQTEEVEF